MFMKTIEERAKREGIISQHRADYPYDKKSVEFGYIQGAYDQKEVDKEELLKLKSAWEKQAQINHDDEANYQQGYHDAIEKACDWLKERVQCGVHPQNAYGFAEEFRKAMEK